MNRPALSRSGCQVAGHFTGAAYLPTIANSFPDFGSYVPYVGGTVLPAPRCLRRRVAARGARLLRTLL